MMARVRLSTARVEMVGAYGGAKWRISMGNRRERGPKMWKMGDERFWRYGCRPLRLIRYFYQKGQMGLDATSATIKQLNWWLQWRRAIGKWDGGIHHPCVFILMYGFGACRTVLPFTSHMLVVLVPFMSQAMIHPYVMK